MILRDLAINLNNNSTSQDIKILTWQSEFTEYIYNQMQKNCSNCRQLYNKSAKRIALWSINALT